MRRRVPGIRARAVLAVLGALLAAAPLALPVAGATPEGLEMEARVLLEGNARVGSWMAIEVSVRNDGPPLVGELRLLGGSQGRTRFGLPVDLPTQSNQTHLLYAQPPDFGATLDVALLSGGASVATTQVAFTVHQPGRLVVAVIAEQPERLVPNFDLLPGANGETPAIIALGPEDLPDRVEAWAPIDRLIWQDIDSNLLRPEQVAALRGWLAGGGRLVIVGGTAGPASLSAFPDEILPYRPSATVDAPAAGLAGFLGDLPRDAPDVPALGGEQVRGRVLATVGDRTIAAEASFGSGVVVLVGIDPSTGWIVELGATAAMWRGLLPAREGGPLVLGDDSPVVNAVSQLPSLALPPIGGLLALLAGYIVLIGPVNYLVLRRLDRREWAWVTMPVLIGLFAAGSYGFGAALRGLDVIVNEVAIVRGAPDATDGLAQVYLGVFSPSRGTYQVELPGGALLSPTTSGQFGGTEASLDLLQGQPSRVRDLVIGFGSLRTLRAESPVPIPRIQADLRLEGNTLKGTVRNLSDAVLEKPAVVLGSSAIILADLPPGGEQAIELAIHRNPFGQALSDKIVGQVFFGDPSRASEDTQRNLVRHGIIDQLTYDPVFGGSSSSLPAESPVLLAWGTKEILDVRIQGQVPRRTGNVLYYIPVPMGVSGSVAFEGDLMRRSVVEVDAANFTMDPFSISLGVGSATVAYRPVSFDGSLAASRLVLGVNFGGEPGPMGEPVPVVPVPACVGDACTDPSAAPIPEPEPCDPTIEKCLPEGEFFDGLPEVEVFNRSGDGSWMRLPHFEQGRTYSVKDPADYVDATSGTVLVRFVTARQEGASFTFQVRIEGEVR